MPNELMSIGYIFGNNLKTGVPVLTCVQEMGVIQTMKYIFSDYKLKEQFSQIQKILSAIQEES